MPALGFIVAVGDCAIDGGVFRESYAVRGGVQDTLPVDLTIRGCPPTPAAIEAGVAAVVAANRREP
jgi:Ni,Fe-hydrogenase III small subunit